MVVTGYDVGLRPYRFRMAVLALTLLAALAIAWRLGLGWHSLGRRGVALIVGAVAVVLVTVVYVHWCDNWGSSQVVQSLTGRRAPPRVARVRRPGRSRRSSASRPWCGASRCGAAVGRAGGCLRSVRWLPPGWRRRWSSRRWRCGSAAEATGYDVLIGRRSAWSSSGSTGCSPAAASAAGGIGRRPAASEPARVASLLGCEPRSDAPPLSPLSRAAGGTPARCRAGGAGWDNRAVRAGPGSPGRGAGAAYRNRLESGRWQRCQPRVQIPPPPPLAPTRRRTTSAVLRGR